MLDLVRVAFARELQDLKRVRTRVGLMLLALVPFSIAIVFGLLALYLWLQQQMEDWQAAGLAAAIALAAGLALVILAKLTTRSPRRPSSITSAQPTALLQSGDQQKRPPPPMTTVSAALAAGIILGRYLPK